jgi:hypothetical protein
MRAVWVQRLGIVAALAVVAFLGIGVYRAGNETVAPPMQIPIEVQGGRAVGHRISARSWSLQYDRMQASADGTFVDVEGVHNGVLYRNGKPYLRLRAQHLSVNNISKDFTATGPLRIETIDRHPRTFDTRDATWLNYQQTLTMKNRIIVGTDGAKLFVEGLTIDVKTGRTRLGRIDGDVRL